MTTEARCTLSDLPVNMCAHCKDKGIVEVDESENASAPVISRIFIAQFGQGICDYCGEEWEVGDPIGYINGVLSCSECVLKARERVQTEVDKFTKNWRKGNG